MVFIFLYCVEWQMVCECFGEGCFIEVFVDILLVICEVWDLKGLYKKVWVGELCNFIGIDLVYEVLEKVEIYLDGE